MAELLSSKSENKEHTNIHGNEKQCNEASSWNALKDNSKNNNIKNTNNINNLIRIIIVIIIIKIKIIIK